MVATAKHYAVQAGRSRTATASTCGPSARDLNETYLPAFKAAVMDGKVDSIMCAYNAIDGFPACANVALLHDHLRRDWGFQGYVVSDCGAIADIFGKDSFGP